MELTTSVGGHNSFEEFLSMLTRLWARMAGGEGS